MPRFKVNHDYSHREHRLIAGEVVELGPHDSEILMHSASSLLTAVPDDTELVRLPDEEEAPEGDISADIELPGDGSDEDGEEDGEEGGKEGGEEEENADGDESRAISKAPKDRMVKKPKRNRNRRQSKDRAGDPEANSAGIMTRSDHPGLSRGG